MGQGQDDAHMSHAAEPPAQLYSKGSTFAASAPNARLMTFAPEFTERITNGAASMTNSICLRVTLLLLTLELNDEMKPNNEMF